MIIRKCAGGIVFHRDKVLILKNDRGHWVLPKGKIRNGSLAVDTALNRVRIEGGVEGSIISTAGETSYEFFSLSRKQPVYNSITWYIMESQSEVHKANREQGFLDGGFFPIEEAIDKVTHNQDKSLVNLSFKKYLTMKEMDDIEEVYV